MKNLLVFFTLLLGASFSFGQNTTTITGTVTDSDSQVWANATWKADIVVPGGGNPQYISGGSVPRSFSGQLDQSGSFLSAVVGNNSQIVPFGTTWKFTVCSATSQPCEILTPISIVGTSINISTFINSQIQPPRINASSLVYAYNINEVINMTHGNGFIDTISGTCYLWNGSWTECGSTISFNSTNPPLADDGTYLSLATVISPYSFGAKCDGVLHQSGSSYTVTGTDDHLALLSMYEAAGSFSPAQTWPTIQGQNGNGPQSTIQYPAKKVCISSTTLNVPPGVNSQGNQATLFFTNNGDGLNLPATDINGIARFNDVIQNLNIIGPGISTSTGACIFGTLVNGAEIDNTSCSQFKFGIEMQQMQYSTFSHDFFTGNVVGCYLTAVPGQITLPSIDNLFIGGACARNSKYGLWLQDDDSTPFVKTDFNSNGSAEIVIGSQLLPYVSSYTLSSGGSGYGTGNLPLIYSGWTCDMSPAGYANATSGVITSVIGFDGGENCTVVGTVSVAGGTGVSITPNITNDAGLGAWDGVDTSTIRGHHSFEFTKGEPAGTTTQGNIISPNTGHGVEINNLSQRNNTFRDIQFPTGSNQGFIRQIVSQAPGTVVDNPFPYNQGTQSSPINANDICEFVNLTSAGMKVNWPMYSSPTYDGICNVNLAPDIGGSSAYMGWDANNLATNGYTIFGPFFGNQAIRSRVVTESFDRFFMDQGGEISWGGGSAAADTFLKRLSAGVLATTNTFQANELTDGNIVINSGSITAGVNGTFSGTIKAATITDGTCSISGGSLTNCTFPNTDKGVVELTAGTVIVTSSKSCSPGTTCTYSITNCLASGATGILSIGNIVVGTSFQINSVIPGGSVLSGDTSAVCWKIN